MKDRITVQICFGVFDYFIEWFWWIFGWKANRHCYWNSEENRRVTLLHWQRFNDPDDTILKIADNIFSGDGWVKLTNEK